MLAEPLLMGIGIDPIVARLSSQYLRRACLMLPFSFISNLLNRFLSAQVTSRMHPPSLLWLRALCGRSSGSGLRQMC